MELAWDSMGLGGSPTGR